ncbi:MAG: hypothetical protein HY660_04085 [Armatimonadetes bacterium]|nr:hypothetical protein [Armatimonadota bacterium]
MSELRGVTVAVLGGDQRMVEIVRQARLVGAEVRVCGGPPRATAAGAVAAATVAEAVKGAKLIVCPVPAHGVGESLYAPFSTERLFLTADALRGAAPGALIVVGRVSAVIGREANAAGVRAVGYSDDVLEIMHAVPTAEGALKVAIENTETTVLGCPTLCIGLGRVGMSVAQLFRDMQAKVTLCARNPSQIARAWAMGLEAVHLNRLAEVIDRFDLLISSTSGLVLTRELLERVREDTLVIDLCSPPGSVDFRAAEALGRKVVMIGTPETRDADVRGAHVIWARGQAGTAPRNAGYDEWQAIMRTVRQELLA